MNTTKPFGKPIVPKKSQRVRVRIVKGLNGVYPEYQPAVGSEYDAEYCDAKNSSKQISPICIIDIKDKRICLKKEEYEIIGSASDYENENGGDEGESC